MKGLLFIRAVNYETNVFPVNNLFEVEFSNLDDHVLPISDDLEDFKDMKCLWVDYYRKYIFAQRKLLTKHSLVLGDRIRSLNEAPTRVKV